MIADLLPVWPLIVGVLVLFGSACWLFMAGCTSHRRDWCYDCHERCDGHVLCRCCGAEGRET
jgi:hypothetical protein